MATRRKQSKWAPEDDTRPSTPSMDFLWAEAPADDPAASGGGLNATVFVLRLGEPRFGGSRRAIEALDPITL